MNRSNSTVKYSNLLQSYTAQSILIMYMKWLQKLDTCMLCTHTKMTMGNPDSVAHVPFVNALRKLPGMTMVGIRDDRAKLLNFRLGKLTWYDGDVKLREFSLLDWTTVHQDGREQCEGLHTPTHDL